MGINSRDGKSAQNGPESSKWHGNSTYQAVELTDEFVREHAGYMTQQEIADMFRISRNTFLEHFGELYTAAKAARKAKRRHQLEQVIDQLAQTAEYNHTHPEAKTNEFTKLMTLWMKRYDNLDAKEITPEDSTPSDVDPREIKVVRPTKDDM